LERGGLALWLGYLLQSHNIIGAADSIATALFNLLTDSSGLLLALQSSFFAFSYHLMVMLTRANAAYDYIPTIGYIC
jgi:hypothetical protein